MKKVCKKIGCNQVSTKEGYCEKHYEPAEAERKEEQKKKYQQYLRNRPYIKLYNSHKWRKLRAEKKENNPICEVCNEEIAEEIHHIKHHYGDLTLFYDYHNLQSLCKSCHSKITQQQAKEKMNGV